jgi:hypothetical protein
MSWFRACQPCSMGLHAHCRNPNCSCCGELDYDHPEPVEADPEQYGREEDTRLDRQLGAWPEASER